MQNLVIWIYRMLRGTLMSRRILLLSTSDRQTGQIHTVVLFYLRDGNTFIVIALKSGEERYPDWYVNLRTNSKVEVQIGASQFLAQAEIVPDAEGQRLLDNFVTAHRFYAKSLNKTRRTIPIVRLTPISKS